MVYRVLVTILVLMLLTMQYELWVGKGSRADLVQLEKRLADQQSALAELRERNDALRAEVEDLKHGQEAIEARARYEFGMIRDGEIFYQIVDPKDIQPQ